MIRKLLFTAFCIMTLVAPGQVFTSLTPFSDCNGSADWADYDNDGDLDLIISGYVGEVPEIHIYENDSSGFTENTPLTILPVTNGTVKWFDYNNDGLFDIFTSGITHYGQGYQQECNVYKGTADGIFEAADWDSVFIVTRSTTMEWADTDNDGLIDISLAGTDSPNFLVRSRIYKNFGDHYEDSELHFQDMAYGSLEWMDFDGDHDMDLLANGYLTSIYATSVYRNEGDTLIRLPQMYAGESGSATWGDYDNDGDPDIVTTGTYTSPYGQSGFFMFYVCKGSYFEMIQGPNHTNRLNGISKFGDVTNDGDLDLVLSVFMKDGSGYFTLPLKIGNGNIIEMLPLCSEQAIDIDLPDFDNDGDTDIFMITQDAEGYHTRLFRNESTTVNQPPAAPSNLNAAVTGNKVTFTWDSSTDDMSDTKSLTYNLYVGTSPDPSDTQYIMQPYANLATGFRKIVRYGNTSQDTSWILYLPDTTQNYYWAVQAIDNSFKGSPFSAIRAICLNPENPEAVTEEPSGNYLNEISLNGTITPSCISTQAYFEYGTDTTQLVSTQSVEILNYMQQPFTHHLTGLDYNSQYYYRIVAQNDMVTVRGNFKTFITGPDGIEEKTVDFAIYPNPTNGMLKYRIRDWNGGQILVFDMKGTKQMTVACEEAEGLLNLGNLRKGIYELLYIGKQGTSNCRIILN